MHPDHFAIVIGLFKYPRLGDPPPDDLNGPKKDAQDVYEWLVHPDQGGIPKENIKLIISPESEAEEAAKPTRADLEEAFLWLDELAGKRSKGRLRSVGRRLYIYAAGHGFSPRMRHGCILAADAAEKRYSANIFPSGWLEWLQDACYFQECVLWMDSCMDRIVFTQPNPPPLDPVSASMAAGPACVFYGAPRNLKAVEKKIPDAGDEWHGIFTWNLLQGLRGAAVNQFGMVTGRSLADWLRQAQLPWLDEDDLKNPVLAKEPLIIEESEAIVFARGLDPLKFKVDLEFPAEVVGRQVRLWGGTPARPLQTLPIQAVTQSVELPAGLYLVEVAEPGLRHGITVTRSAGMKIVDKGPPPTETTGLFRISIDPGDPTADIQLFGDGFRSVDVGAGTLEGKLPHGLYKLRIRVGRQIVEKVVLLDADWISTPAAAEESTAKAIPELPQITSAIPLAGTRTTHEYHMALRDAVISDTPDVKQGEGASLLVMARAFSNDESVASRRFTPWADMSIHAPDGKLIASMDSGLQHEIRERDPVAARRLELSPGPYEFRYKLPRGGMVAQSVILVENWQTEIYLLHRMASDSDGSLNEKPAISLLMRSRHEQGNSVDELVLEKARVALADERPVLGDDLKMLLLDKSDNPVAGIIGGHLLLLEYQQGGRHDLEELNAVVSNLRAIVGYRHPDVEALALMCLDPELHPKTAFQAPPMFERSWRIIVQEAQNSPRLVPSRLWKKVYAQLPASPFLTWSVDPDIRAAALSSMQASLFEARRAGYEPALQPPAAEGFPAGAARMMSPPMMMPAPVAAAAAPQAASGRRKASLAEREALGIPPAAFNTLRRGYRPR